MKIEDVIQLLDNRLKEFKLSRDYARMRGDLKRMNVADEEIIALEDTLYKLNLLLDTSKSAAVKDAILAEIITDGSVAVLDKYDITSYATDPLHEKKIMDILSKMGVMDTVEKIDKYIKSKALSSSVTGEMVMSAALAYDVDVRLMMSIMEQDSRFGTVGVAVRTLNPGNVGNDDDGNTRDYESWQEGVTAVAEWLNRHRGSTIIPEITEKSVLEPVATSTPLESPTASSSLPLTGQAPITATSTTTTVINIPTTSTGSTGTSTVSSVPNGSPQATTPASPAVATGEGVVTATSTPTTDTATSTPAIEPHPSAEEQEPIASPEPSAEADESEPINTTSTPTTATTTDETATSTSSHPSPGATAGEAGQATSTGSTTLTTSS